jgi:putative membrane protein
MNRYLLIASTALLLVACNKTGADSTSAASGAPAAASTTPDAVALAGSPPDADPAARPAPAFVAEAGVADMYEIQAGQIALKKSKNNDVKGFAKMTVEDHTKSTTALREAIKDSGRADLAPPTQLSEEKQAMIEDLNKAPDTLFDTMYLTQQATVHSDAERILSAYAANGDAPPLKAFAGKTAPVVQKHLDRVHQIEAKLAK